MKLKKMSGIIFSVLCMSLVPFFSYTCQASEEAAQEETVEEANQAADKVVRVAYFDLGDYYRKTADGELDSYDSAYLDMVSNYTGYQFEYVDCKTWDNALTMLENHEIDLVGTMQWNMEREEKYAICEAHYGYAVAELAALLKSGYIYEDYSHMSGAVIGCVQNYVIADYLQTLMQEHQFTAEIRTYESQQALDDALESGEIDIIAANAHAMHEDWEIIAKSGQNGFLLQNEP